MSWQFIYHFNSAKSHPTSKIRFLKTTMNDNSRLRKMSTLQMGEKKYWENEIM